MLFNALLINEYCCDNICPLCSPTTGVNGQLKAIRCIAVSLQRKLRKSNSMSDISTPLEDKGKLEKC